MTLSRVRRVCDVGEGCPALDVDTPTGDAFVTGYLPNGEEATVRIPSAQVPKVLHGLGPDDFGVVGA